MRQNISGCCYIVSPCHRIVAKFCYIFKTNRIIITSQNPSKLNKQKLLCEASTALVANSKKEMPEKSFFD